MNEHATGTCGQKIQHVAFENVVPQRNEGRGAGVYDTDSLQIADLADEIVEPLIVDRTAPKDIDVFGCQRLILSEGRVDRVGVKAAKTWPQLQASRRAHATHSTLRVRRAYVEGLALHQSPDERADSTGAE